MATEIGRSLEDIDIKVKALNKTLSASTAETKELDKALKLDPKATETVERKMGTLQTAVGTATQKVALLKQKQDEAYKAMARGDLSAAEYKKIELAVIKAENEVRQLNGEIQKTAKMKVDQTAASFDKLTGNLNKAKAAADKLSKVALGIVTALGAAAVAFAVTGSELDKTSKQFKISAEQLQIQRNLYQKATGSADNFDAAMTQMNKVMTSIAKGSGKAYNEVLEKLGVSTVDSTGKQKSLAQVYNEVMGALRQVTDENEQAMMANILFGSSGTYVAEVAALSNSEVSAYNQALAENGIVSSESAAKAREVTDAMDGVKQQLQAASAELMVALLPVILQLVEIAQVTIIPILNTVAKWFASMSPQQLQFIFFLLMLVIILPKIISIITAIVGVIKAIAVANGAAAASTGALSAASMPLQPILLAVAAAILIVVLLLAMLSGKSKDVTGQLTQQQKAFGSMQKQYNSMSSDMGGTVAMTSSNSSTQTVNYDVNINAHGDTPISQEAAELIADDLADKINTQLGGKI
jgi:phage-related minor tail protein